MCSPMPDVSDEMWRHVNLIAAARIAVEALVGAGIIHEGLAARMTSLADAVESLPSVSDGQQILANGLRWEAEQLDELT